MAMGKGGKLTMFEYKKFLEYPIKIKKTDPRLANVIITQYGGAYCKSSTVKKCTKNNLKSGLSSNLCKFFSLYLNFYIKVALCRESRLTMRSRYDRLVLRQIALGLSRPFVKTSCRQRLVVK